MNDLNFSHTPKQAFTNGFLKGFTAPSMLFRQRKMPELQEIRTIQIPNNTTITQALSDDWKKIGLDFYNAIEKI